jgi:hypothetical protein
MLGAPKKKQPHGLLDITAVPEVAYLFVLPYQYPLSRNRRQLKYASRRAGVARQARKIG